MTSFWCLYCELGTYFTPCSSVSIVNFEQVNAGFVMITTLSLLTVESQGFFAC